MAVIDYQEQCEQRLAQMLGHRHCVWTGNGTSALYLAYALCPEDRPKIILPAIMCIHPMMAVHYADRVPVFCDVKEADATIDPDEVERLLDQDSSIGAVLAVHLYGHAAGMDRLKQICSSRNVILIEDLAQAFGGTFRDGSLFGSQGDIAVASFGYSKILDAGDGGALLLNDASLVNKARSLEQHIPAVNDQKQDLEQGYKELFYTIWRLGQKDPSFYRLFDAFPALFKSLFVYRGVAGVPEQILGLLDTVNEEVTRRQELAQLYQDGLQDVVGISFFEPASGVPWRFTFRVSADQRERVLAGVREDGFDISSWYPSITDWTPSGREQGRDCFPIAHQLEREVVNVWVDQQYDTTRVNALIESIKKYCHA